MKKTIFLLICATLATLCVSARAASGSRMDAVLPLFEISEEDGGLVAIEAPLALLPEDLAGDAPQVSDTVSVDLTNELLGTGLA